MLNKDAPAHISSDPVRAIVEIPQSPQHPNSRGVRRLALYALSFGLSLFVAVVCSELILRSTGHRPWTYDTLDRNEPTMNEPDPELGWHSKRGTYTVPPYVPAGQSTSVTVLDGGRRATGTTDPGGRREIVFVGDSFTYGLAISDHETYPWKLQQMFPSFKVLNYGTSGYGTYQSLLVLERELPLLTSPAVVVFGFFFHQEVRNVATPEWLRGLSLHQRRAHVYLPYVSLDSDGTLVRHPPVRYPILPFMEQSALMTFMVDRYVRFTGERRRAQGRQVMERLVVEMKHLSEKHGARFLVAMLDGPKETMAYYTERFQHHQIELVDCNFPLTDDMRVPGEGHPNDQMNTLWAHCIQQKLVNGVLSSTGSPVH